MLNPASQRSRRVHRSIFAMVGAGAVLMSCAATSNAQSDNNTPAAHQELPTEIHSRLDAIDQADERNDFSLLIRAIDDPVYIVREAATDALMHDQWKIDDIRDVLDSEPLTYEQRQRLVFVVYQRTINTEFGALGISMRWIRGRLQDGGEVEVTDLIAGMPAERFLQIGDRITHIDGAVLYSNSDLGSRVRDKGPGDVVAVRFKRTRRSDTGGVLRFDDGSPQYEVHDVRFNVGSREQLKQNNDNFRQRNFDSDEFELRQQAERAISRFSADPRPAFFEDPIVINNMARIKTDLRNRNNPQVLAEVEQLLAHATNTIERQPARSVSDWRDIRSMLVDVRDEYARTDDGWEVLNRLALRCQYLIDALSEENTIGQ